MTHGYLPLDMRFFARDTRCIFVWFCSESLKTTVYLLLSCIELLEYTFCLPWSRSGPLCTHGALLLVRSEWLMTHGVFALDMQ